MIGKFEERGVAWEGLGERETDLRGSPFELSTPKREREERETKELLQRLILKDL